MLLMAWRGVRLRGRPEGLLRRDDEPELRVLMNLRNATAANMPHCAFYPCAIILRLSGDTEAMQANTHKIIDEVVRERFRDANIIDVRVTEDTDADGDPVFKITVVFEARSGRVDAHKAAGLIRHVRPKLLENNETKFPHFRFVSKADAQRLKPEAA